MVDRSYLPYKSAREYQDRKMAKWMGFFLSEHSSALNKSGQLDSDQETGLSLAEIHLYLGQAYSQQLAIRIIYRDQSQRKSIEGKLESLNFPYCGFRGQDKFVMVMIDQILAIERVEEAGHGE